LVLERSAELGGRARSWRHAASGDEVDIGPHVVHSEYANFLTLLGRLGTADRITWQPRKVITLATTPPTVLRHRPLPPPLSLLPDLARAPGLDFRDLWSNNTPTWHALKFGEEDVPALDRLAALDYLRLAGVTERMIDWFWRFAAMVVMNVPLEHCSAAALLRVHAQLIGRRGIHFGFPAAGLSELYVPQAERLIRAAGGGVRRNAEVVRVEPEAVTVGDGTRIGARFCVLALPPQDLAKVRPDLADTTAFVPSPYVSTYLWLDRKLTGERFWALPWSPGRLNYDFYDLTEIRPGWQARASVIAANFIYAQRAAAMDDAALVRAAHAELALFVPEAARARVIHADVHRIPMAICQPRPGTESRRPSTRTSVPGLFIAGDWTRTALPSSMESAARSGFLAAEAILADLGRPRRFSLGVRSRDGFAGLVRATTVAARALGPLLAKRKT
jgi:uncharacterized protein with NAD-binding domain and iron-sulfur cluster